MNPAEWDALDHAPSPFLEHGFLRALELSGSVGAGTGWDPCYLLAFGEREPGSAPASSALLGAICTFVKEHSYGEYIFDFAWARASLEASIPYYPKLVVAAPFTPASGRRILLDPGLSATGRERVTRALLEAVHALADERRCNSIHFLFVTREERERLVDHGFLARTSFQYHFDNPGDRSFEDFLARLTSRRRKQITKERRRVAAAIDGARFVPGAELDDDRLSALDRFYRATTKAHGGQAYLRPGFFAHLAQHLPSRLWMLEVERRGVRVAGALYLETPSALFGRYWGADQTIDLLHFEVACYLGIERCIARGLPRLEAGAQGEHKLLRGFLPRATHSAHFIRHAGLRRVIAAHLAQEEVRVAEEMRALAAYGPYRQDG